MNGLAVALKSTDPTSELTSVASSSHTFLPCLSLSVGLEPFAVRNPVTSLSLQRKSTPSAILHCCCLGRTWLTGVSIILVEMDFFAIRWVRQETIPGVTFKRGEKRYIWSYFPTEFRTSYSSSTELYENADNCLQFSRFMNIMCRCSVGFLNGRLMNRKVWI